MRVNGNWRRRRWPNDSDAWKGLVEFRVTKCNNRFNAGSLLLLQFLDKSLIKVLDGMVIIRCTQFRTVGNMVVYLGACVEFFATIETMGE